METEKRNVPPALKRLLDLDIYLSDVVVKYIEKFLPLKQLKVHYKVLEYSCHGIPWTVGLLALIWLLSSKYLYQIQVNIFIGILLDIVLVAIIKAAVRRRRPAVNDDPFAVGPDKYSFPSGHASRSTLILYLLMNVWPVPVIFYPSLLAWCTSVCLSRLLMRRHHIFDIFAGIVLGLMEGIFMSLIFLDESTCASIIRWMSDEPFGGEDDSM